jgi:uncharacterized protein (DUF1800 family)
MSNDGLALMAHLMRRAGFGATRDELERYIEKGYDATVEDLLHPGDPGDFAEDVQKRRSVGFDEGGAAGATWMVRMIHTNNPLEEKMTLFLHGLFPVRYMSQGRALINQTNTFRRHALGSFHDVLAALSRDPAMLLFLNNNDNHMDAVNENYGRELIELFSMGIGNYTEQDVKECARAFTGWTLGNADYMAVRAGKNSFDPYGSISWHFQYLPEDHDDTEKTFLGETGRFNGEDIIEIITRQPDTARFICTRLFQYFAADEVDEDGERVIDEMVAAYFASGHEIRSLLRTLFQSDYFKSPLARYARVKGPVALVVGAVRMAGSYPTPEMGVGGINGAVGLMGQGLFSPPSVEGWHEGREWIETGSLVERVNFIAKEFRDVSKSGVRRIIQRLADHNGGRLTPEELVDWCVDLAGPVAVSDETRSALIDHVAARGDVDLRGHEQGDESENRVGEVLGLIAAAPEYQME